MVTSVVSLVTMEAVENRSILEKEKLWIFRYISIRRLEAKPEEQ